MFPEIAAAFTAVKSLKDLAAGSDNHQFIGLINDLYESLMLAREKILQLQEENARLKQQVNELNDRKALKEDIEFRVFAVFKKSTNEGPYCNACWGDKEKLIHLHDSRSITKFVTKKEFFRKWVRDNSSPKRRRTQQSKPISHKRFFGEDVYQKMIF